MYTTSQDVRKKNFTRKGRITPPPREKINSVFHEGRRLFARQFFNKKTKKIQENNFFFQKNVPQAVKKAVKNLYTKKLLKFFLHSKVTLKRVKILQ